MKKVKKQVKELSIEIKAKDITYYKADDGTLFDDEYKCAEYEFLKDYSPIAEKLILWDKYGAKRNITHPIGLEDIYAIYCTSITAAKVLQKWGEKYKIRNPFDTFNINGGEKIPLGTFIKFCDEWRIVDTIIKEFNMVKNQMEMNEEKITIPEDV